MAIQINVDPNVQHLIKGFEKGINQFNSRVSSRAKLKVGIDEKSFTRPLGRITGQVNMFESAMEAANARVIAFGASTAVLATVVKSLRDIAKTAIEVEAAFTDINRILNLSATNLEKFGNQLFNTAQKTASTFQAASEAALEFSRQGLKTEEVLKRTSDALTLVRLTGMNAKKSVDLLTATVNAFTDLDTTAAVNKFVAVETKFAVAARDLVEGLSRVGSAAQDAKVDFDELNGLITAVQQTTGRGGAVIGNALKTIFTRLQRESTLSALERFDVTVRDIQGNILPATRILDNFASKYDKLADSTQAYLREQVAGVFQANILSAVLKDLNKQQSISAKALQISAAATNEADAANQKLNQTLSSLLQNTSTELAKFQKSVGDEAFMPLAKAIVGLFKSTLGGINGLLDSEADGIFSTFAKGALKGFGNVLQGPVFIGLMKVFGQIAKQSFNFLTQAVPALLNITTATQKRAQTEEFIVKLLSQDAKLASQIAGLEGNIAAQMSLVLDRSRAITAQYQTQQRIAGSLSRTIVDGGSFITGSGVRGSAVVKNKAGGYMPSIRAEQSAISRGVGGAGNGAYPVVIPNFAFGGGKRGPVVANSSEVMVPNYGGSGGSAIFNQDMISRYGMPAGAVPIAAKGIGVYDPYAPVPGRGIPGLAGRLKKYDFEKYVNATEKERNSVSRRVSAVLAGRIFESRLQGFKYIDLTENLSEPDVQVGPYKIREAKLSLQAALNDKKVVSGKKVGDGVIVPSTANKSQEDKLEKLGIDVMYAKGQTHNKLFGKADELIRKYRYVRRAEIPNRIPLASGYIPRFAAGRMPLGSLASATSISSASAQNPNIHPEDLVKTGYDNHISLPIRSVMKRGMSPKVYGDKVEAEVAKNPKIKAMGYRLAHGGELYGNDNSAVDLIKTEGGILKGVMEVKGGELKAPAALKTGRVISENLSRPLVRGMFQGPPGEKLAYDTHLITNARRGIKPQNIAGMMRKGAANMAGGYVPHFAAGLKPMSVGIGTQRGHQIADSYGSNLQRYFYGVQGGLKKLENFSMLAADQQKILIQNLRTNARSIDAVTGSNKALELVNREISRAKKAEGEASKKNAVATNQNTTSQKKNTKDKQSLLNSPGASMAVMMAAPMVAGFVEQMISQGKSRTEMTTGQRFAAGAASDITTFATSGAMIGGPAGAVIGGILGLGKAALGSSLSLAELQEKAENYNRTTEQVTGAAEQYIQAQKDMASASTAQELKDAQKRAANSMEVLRKSGDGLDQKFQEAQGSIDKMSAAADEFAASRSRVSALNSANISAKDFAIILQKGVDADSMQQMDMGKTNKAFIQQFQGRIGELFKGFGPRGLEATINSGKYNPDEFLRIANGLLKFNEEEFEAAQTFLNTIKGKGLYGVFLKTLPEMVRTQREADEAAAALIALGQNFALFKEKLIRMADEASFLRSLSSMDADFSAQLAGQRLSSISGSMGPQYSARAQARIDEAKLINNAKDTIGDFADKNRGTILDLQQYGGEGIQEYLNRVITSLDKGEGIPQSLLDEGKKILTKDQEGVAYQKLLGISREDVKMRTGLLNQRMLTKDRLERSLGQAGVDEANIGVQRSLDAKLRFGRRSAATEDFFNQRRERVFSERMSAIDLSVASDRSKNLGRMGLVSARGADLEAARQRQLELELNNLKASKDAEIEKLQNQTDFAIRNTNDPDDIVYIYEEHEKRLAEINNENLTKRTELEQKSLAEKDRIESEMRLELARLRDALRQTGKGAFGRGMDNAFTNIRNDFDTFEYRLGDQLPIKFRDGMVSAMEAAMDRTEDLGDALRGVAVEFLRTIRSAFLQQAANSIMLAVGTPFGKGNQKGGIIRAASGMYISGSRTGDKNPALLEDGEYVLNRNAVRAMGGPKAIDRINFGMAPRFAGGGAAVNLAPDSDQLSARWLYSGDPIIDEIRQAEAEKARRREEKRQKKAALKQMIISTLISTGVSMGLSAGFKALTGPKGGTGALKGSFGLDSNMTWEPEPLGSSINTPTPLQSFTGNLMNPTNLGGYAMRQSGGYIGNGPRNIDSIPAFMAGGEYVMNNRAVRKYGLGFMNRLNGGFIPTYQTGGSVAESPSNLGNSNSTNTNNINITVNVGGDGSKQSSSESGAGTAQNDKSSSGDKENNNRKKGMELTEKIKQVVLQTIQEEQRSGGTLNRKK